MTRSKQRQRKKQPPAVQVRDAPGYAAFSGAYPTVPSGSCWSRQPQNVLTKWWQRFGEERFKHLHDATVAHGQEQRLPSTGVRRARGVFPRTRDAGLETLNSCWLSSDGRVKGQML